MNEIGAIKIWDINKSAQPVKDDVGRTLELLRGTGAGAAFVTTHLGNMEPERGIRCQAVDKLVAALGQEIGPGGDKGVLDLIAGLRRQFAEARYAREGFERMRGGDRSWQGFADKCDEMLSQDPPIYPDSGFFGLWERDCEGYDDYRGVFSRMQRCEIEPNETFVSGMMMCCEDKEQVIGIIRLIGTSGVCPRSFLRPFVSWARAHRDQCSDLFEFLRDFVTSGDTKNLEGLGMCAEALKQIMDSPEDGGVKGKKKKKKGGLGRHVRPANRGNWRKPGVVGSVGDGKSERGAVGPVAGGNGSGREVEVVRRIGDEGSIEKVKI